MLEKPNLSDESILSALQNGFGISAQSVDFLPLGNDSNAWAYRAFLDHGASYFLKVKKNLTNPRGITIPHYIHSHGMAQVVAPIATPTGELWHPAGETGEFVLLLYPFLEGDNGMNTGLTDAQWIEYGTFLKTLHTTHLPPDLAAQLSRESFIPTNKSLDSLRQIQERLAANRINGPIQAELATFWQEKASVIEQVVRRTQELAATLRPQALDYVLCHADIHTANLLITPDQQMFVVDWDETILAPRERDLMFVIGSAIAIDPPVQPEQEKLFFQGYGDYNLNWPALAYYRYEWAVQDMADFAARVFLMDELGEVSQQAALRWFKGLFNPNDEIDMALQSEAKLPK